jgi:hypothetical protein
MKLNLVECRELLELPATGELEEQQIKSAFKRLALVWSVDMHHDHAGSMPRTQLLKCSLPLQAP